MNPHKKLSRSHSILAFGLGVLLCLLSACQQSKDKETPRSAQSDRHQETAAARARTGTEEVHALLILLGNDRKIRETVKTTESEMKKQLRRLSSHCKVNLTLMKSVNETTGTVTTQTLQNGQGPKPRTEEGGLIQSQQVVAWLQNLQPNADDTILIYYNGHGKIGSYETHNLIFDEMFMDTLDRGKLSETLKQKPARLRMLITDTCSETVDAEDIEFRGFARTRERKHNYMEDLFLTHAGFLDITAASPGEVAIGHPDVGGHFTYALFTHGCSPDADKNNDTFITWQEAFDTAGIETDKLFKQASKELSEVLGTRTNRQRTQQPIAYSLPKPLEQPTKPTTEPPPPQIDEPPIVSPEAIEVETTATLNFTSVPPDAEVFIDDAFAGNTPLRDFEIEMDGRSTKPIEVTVKATGHKDAVKNLWVQRGKSSDLKFELTRMGPPTIHALLIISLPPSLHPGIREAHEETSNTVNGLLQMIASELGSELKSTFLKGDTSEVNPSQISQWFKALRPNRNDIVFVYYFGEGMADQNGELYLMVDIDALFPRKEIVKSIQQLQCRLKIFITDSDSAGPPVTDNNYNTGTTGGVRIVKKQNRQDTYNTGTTGGVRIVKKQNRQDTFRHLFLQHEGFLNLTAATEGEEMLLNLEMGSFFSSTLIDVIYDFQDTNSDGFASWNEVFWQTRRRTMELFNQLPLLPEQRRSLERRGIQSQRPKYYGELPKRF